MPTTSPGPDQHNFSAPGRIKKIKPTAFLQFTEARAFNKKGLTKYHAVAAI
jgi:hypothetical protein